MIQSGELRGLLGTKSVVIKPILVHPEREETGNSMHFAASSRKLAGTG